MKLNYHAQGYEYLTKLILQDEQRTGTIMAARTKYYALGACSALFKYLESSHSLVFPPRTLRMSYQPLDGTCLIDTDSARNLELVTNVG